MVLFTWIRRIPSKRDSGNVSQGIRVNGSANPDSRYQSPKILIVLVGECVKMLEDVVENESHLVAQLIDDDLCALEMLTKWVIIVWKDEWELEVVWLVVEVLSLELLGVHLERTLVELKEWLVGGELDDGLTRQHGHTLILAVLLRDLFAFFSLDDLGILRIKRWMKNHDKEAMEKGS
ncbi:hypothetical protein Tco_1439126 [Tanacetum coccineum]